jgi:hypothetical protein
MLLCLFERAQLVLRPPEVPCPKFGKLHGILPVEPSAVVANDLWITRL